jgi:hypothetical protein
MKVKEKVGLIWDLSEDELRSVYPLPASAKDPAPTREGAPFDRLPPDLRAMRLWLDVRVWEKWIRPRRVPNPSCRGGRNSSASS